MFVSGSGGSEERKRKTHYFKLSLAKTELIEQKLSSNLLKGGKLTFNINEPLLQCIVVCERQVDDWDDVGLILNIVLEHLEYIDHETN